MGDILGMREGRPSRDPLDMLTEITRPDRPDLGEQVLSLPDQFWDLLPVAIYVCGPDGIVLQYNRRAAELWGRSPRFGDPTERFCGSYRLYRLDGTLVPHADCPMADALRTGNSVRDHEVMIEREDGSRIIALVNIVALKDERGKVSGAINCFQDITERKQVENRLRDSERRFQELLGALPAAVYTTDADGKLTFYNEAAATMWGHRPQLGDAEWCGSWRLYWPDGRPMRHDECPMAIAVKEGRAVRGKEAVAERPDGSRVPFVPYPTPLFDHSGNLVGAVNMLIDIADRQQAESYAQRLASIVESSDDAIISKDLDGIITSWNRGAERLYGYLAEEIIGKPVKTLIPAERQDEEPRILERIRRGDRIDHYDTIRCRKDGSLIHVSLTVSPVRDSQGKIVGASKIARDISDRIRLQDQQKLLVGEMKHRVKNSLTTVQALAMQTLHSASPAEREAFIDRLHALARAHDMLTVDNWNGASLSAVLEQALLLFQEGPYRDRVSIKRSAEVWIDANRSMMLSMALYELATNAVKYGALSNDSGRISLACERQWEPHRLAIVWRESEGPAVKPPQRRGFGLTLIERALAGNAGRVTLDFAPEGLACTIEVAL